MDRLTSIDTGFLAQERAGAHMHIGSVMLFEGRAPDREEFLEHLVSRLHSRPALPPEARVPALSLAAPCGWTTRASTSITTCGSRRCPSRGASSSCACWPAGSSPSAWTAPSRCGRSGSCTGSSPTASRSSTRPHHRLGRRRQRRGHHHGAVRLDLDRNPGAVDGAPDPWTPAPEPSDAAIAAQGVADLAGTPFRLARDAVTAVSDLGRTLGQARDAVEAVGEVASGLVAGAPKTPLNQHCGSHRRVVWIHADLAELKAIKNALGGTVNDVVLNDRGRRPAALAALARRAHRGPGAAGRRARVGAGRGRARPARQQDHDHGRTPAGLRAGPDGPPGDRHRLHEAPEGVQAGARGRAHRRAAGLRAPDRVRAGLAAELLPAHVQLVRHQRARAPVPALPARARAGEARAGGVPGRGADAGGGDHELQRRRRHRPDRRLRRHARPRGPRRCSRRRSRSCGRPRSARKRPFEREQELPRCTPPV